MRQVEIFSKNVADYEAWYDKYPEVYQSEVKALQEQFLDLPPKARGIEIGVGTGRFAVPLGIKEGLEPSEEMAAKALKKGIEIVEGVAENLPYGDLQFDFVLFVTICHLNDIKNAMAEAKRVLKPGGMLIIGFLDKEQSIAKYYEEKRQKSTFFKYAVFYSVDQIKKLLNENGFKKMEFTQTLFGNLDEIKEVQFPKKGFGQGSFVIVKAIRK